MLLFFLVKVPLLKNNVSACFRTWGLDVEFLKFVEVQIRFDENLDFSVHSSPLVGK